MTEKNGEKESGSYLKKGRMESYFIAASSLSHKTRKLYPYIVSIRK